MTSIKQLTLYTAELDRMLAFYTQMLGAEQVHQQSDAFTITLGASQIQFRTAAGETNPFYHVAINIAANHFQEAKRWLSSFGELLTENGEDQAYFDFFDAYSCYIEDPAGNIIELISRQQAAPVVDVPFSPQQLLSIGEINITTTDVEQAAMLLKQASFPVEMDRIETSGLNFVGIRTCSYYSVPQEDGGCSRSGYRRSIRYSLNCLQELHCPYWIQVKSLSSSPRAGWI